MQRLLSVVILAVILIGLPLLLLSHTASSTAGPDIPNKEATGSITRASNSSAGVTISIAMTGVLDE